MADVYAYKISWQSDRVVDTTIHSEASSLDDLLLEWSQYSVRYGARAVKVKTATGPDVLINPEFLILVESLGVVT